MSERGVRITEEEAVLVIDALDSHAYWQLSEPVHRNDGYVLEEGMTPEIHECYELIGRIEKQLKTP